ENHAVESEQNKKPLEDAFQLINDDVIQFPAGTLGIDFQVTQDEELKQDPQEPSPQNTEEGQNDKPVGTDNIIQTDEKVLHIAQGFLEGVTQRGVLTAQDIGESASEAGDCFRDLVD